MRTKTILAALFVFLATAGFDCINDPIIVAVNLDPIEVCADVQPSGSFSETETFAVNDYVPTSYRDNIKALRIYDITIHVHDAPPTGNVSGSLSFLDGGAFRSLLTFNGTYADFHDDVSILAQNGPITINQPNLAILINLLTAEGGPPSTLTLRSQGSADPSPSVEVCCVVKFQASAEVD